MCSLRRASAQYLIPLKPGWFKLQEPPPAPSRPFADFTPETAWSTPSGLVGEAGEGSRVGVTSSTQAQIEAFVTDAKLGAGSAIVPATSSDRTVWHLNLLRFKARDGGRTYSSYARPMGGGPDGLLGKYGARSTLASPCFRSLIGDIDWDRAIIAEYPCRESYLTMGESPTPVQPPRLGRVVVSGD